MDKLRVGIFFGGQGREREISFAGGRTVYDNLNKALFDPLPVFIDSFGNFIILRWEFIYKGTIRDFYPPVSFVPASRQFQYYAENLPHLSEEHKLEMANAIGDRVSIEELKERIDIAFLSLHGPFGEDGRVQGLLEYHGIPYTGSGILPSAIGIDKSVQKLFMSRAGFKTPAYRLVDREKWISGKERNAFNDVKDGVGFPCVVKPAGQGSSIGVSILESADEAKFMSAVEKALFTRWLNIKEWRAMSVEQKNAYVRDLADIREGIGLPVRISHPEPSDAVITDPYELVKFLDTTATSDGFVLESVMGENTVIVEEFIDGREFSCIVLEDQDGIPVALPPTEIKKGRELFDYRSKYLPGLSRKITPIDLPGEQIEAIRSECERLFSELRFDVYARIDGFLGKNGTIFLNDPNTTSGMMPSSFFFHQAAEIGLNPSQFLTYIIRTSLRRRQSALPGDPALTVLLSKLDKAIEGALMSASDKIRVAVVLGGYSSERHISLESGRNVFEKLSASEKYAPFPVFLTGDSSAHELYRIPVNLLLKDNADDIRDKILHFSVHPVISSIIERCANIRAKYAGSAASMSPEKISYQQLAEAADEVFIALHGRPGEDGEIQQKLEALGLPYNGSGRESSSVTIDKFRTNEILRQHGFLVAKHRVIMRNEWQQDRKSIAAYLEKEIGIPFIAKPVDDGCSSAVKKINSLDEFDAFCELLFRTTDDLPAGASAKLRIKPREEFPIKQEVLVEELIGRNGAAHFLEITGGMLTRFTGGGEIEYEVFESSEALAGGEVLSLEEKFLAGEGQNITPARYAMDPAARQRISDQVKDTLGRAAKVLGVLGYCRIDAFVRIYADERVEVIFIEVNSLPGMTPATCIFHQAAISNYKPLEFIDRILDFGKQRATRSQHAAQKG